MSLGNCETVTFGCVSVCTKSGGLVTRSSVVVGATGGTSVAAVSVDGATTGGGVFRCLHAGIRTSATRINPRTKPLRILFIASSLLPFVPPEDDTRSRRQVSGVRCQEI